MGLNACSCLRSFDDLSAESDLNGDGEVNSADSVLLMKYLAGYEVKFGN